MRIDAIRNVLAIGATTCALILAFTVNQETRRLGAEVRVRQERTLAWMGRVQAGEIAWPEDFPDSFVAPKYWREIHAIRAQYYSDSAPLLREAEIRLGRLANSYPVPAVYAISGLCHRKLRDRTSALADLEQASKQAGPDDNAVRLIAFGYAGLTLAESANGLRDSLARRSLLRQALRHYDSALVYDVGGLQMSLWFASLRERVRKSLGEDKRDIDAAKPGQTASLAFRIGIVFCVAGLVVAVVALIRPRSM